ncbi:IRE protein kinase [Cladophialophora yegresii CBS 114405]|uniref:non-specific serine/threonine protein kinase n=1 Tax=Cladophialophora yegresii CBS 114405 TaxID=1182544 RepID=W9WLE0_9EURO|nr:IRE protein kinase [Cladophialophora yegresii CBS 114405]EXJ65406.1 IRE protein kinase [Cladophialophora yegresii CBS 114405]
MAKPPLRPAAGRGGGSNANPKSMLTWAILFLLLATTQSQSVHQSDVPQRLVASTQSLRSESSRRPARAGRSPAEIPLLKNDITTARYYSTDEDTEHQKLRALAPAYDSLSGSAVRAPLVQQSIESSPRGGLSALPSARLLQDWEVENIVLLATIDGTIHARDRKTGNERWSLGIPNSPMIETIHHHVNRSDLDYDGSPYEDDYMFIVEPSKDGNLYVQHRDPRIGLQRLGVTVKSLAAQTPQFVDNPPIVTISSQETTAYIVDAATGTILQRFDKYRGFSSDDQSRSCRRLSGFELDDPACDPIGTINLGRVEYTIQITHKITSQLLCTIKFAEWLPNKMDSDLQQQYVAPLDNYHIQSYYNGRIIGIDDSENGKIPRFTQMFDTPVARVFDVVRPLDNHDESANLVLLSRPTDSPLLSSPEIWRNEMQRAERVFVNKTEAGVWYAMSELAYPGVTSGAAPASSNWNYDTQPLDLDGDLDEIVGVHMLSGHESTTPVRLTISGPPPVTDLAEEAENAMAALESKIPPALLPVVSHPLMSLFNIICVSIFLFAIGLQMRSPVMVKLQRFLRKAGVEVAAEKIQAPPASPTSAVPEEQDVPVAEVAPQREATGVVSEVLENAITTPARSRAQSAAVSVASPVKTARAPDPNDDSSDVDSEDDKDQPDSNSNGTVEGEAQPRRRHAKRGKRGGKKNKKGKKTMNPDAMDEKEQLVAETPTKDGLLQVGKLRIDTKEDRCLGRGSNGTAVFPGSLDGREVAVKRLIRTSNSLAAKEIKHLLSSDENPHVIRYFGKEESQHFTYIALERFTTSLDQFIERPLLYPDLVKLPEGFDVKDALRQITDGVQHLHSLKLVHRDIKPQNVLVKAVKSSRPTNGLPKLQFVISDFGLCKPLEEGPESTFAPTANHTAAGTTGWRAPELLVGSRSAVTALNASSNSTSKSTTHSSETTVIDPPSGRRATKAIDIFSLGCVFYYVMTQGRHPFDVGGTSLGRDLNIKENKFSTEDLRLHDYQFDADDLIMQMLKHDPKERPTTDQILRHPYFWDVADKLEFLCDVSDCYEREKNSVPNIHDENAMRTPTEKASLAELAALEILAPNVIGPSKDWLRALPKTFLTEMGKQRKYTGSKMIDLLRVIRNKKNHFHDLPEDVKEQMLGGSAKGYYEFWAKRFPSLLINCHCLIQERGLVGQFKMERWFE